MKNQSGLEEIESASNAVEILGGEAMSYKEVQSIRVQMEILRTVVTSYKLMETDKKYPRRAGTPQKGLCDDNEARQSSEYSTSRL